MNPPVPVRRAEIVAVGTELLLGEIVDTNGAWLAARLANLGVDVHRSVRVGDNLARVREAIETALERSDLVITSGGLGPTEDDLTREAIATVVNETPAVDEALERELRDFFARRGRPMPDGNLKQAWRIPSCRPLANPRGTAPGWLVRIARGGDQRWIAALPGPPHELEPMFERELLPHLTLPGDRLHRTTLKTSGIGESEVAERLREWTGTANPSVATYARSDGVHVRVAAKAEDASRAAALVRPLAAKVTERLGDFVWGVDDDSLAGVVIHAARRAGVRLAILDQGTGGRLGTALADADKDASVLIGTVVACQVDAMNALRIPVAADAGFAATEAADRIRAFFAADAAIAVGELRPADGEGGDVSADVSVCDANGSEEITLRLAGRDGTWLHDRVVLRALDLLRRRLRTRAEA